MDASDCIVSVNVAWAEFARANDGAHLLEPDILGRRLWDLISDPSTQEIYRGLVGRIREGVTSVRFGFRCDAPGRRRLLQMTMSPLKNEGVRFEVIPLVLQDRPAVPLLQASVARGGGVIRICGWCKRIPGSDGAWLEIENAVLSFNLFDEVPLPDLTHGICPACNATMMAAMDDAELAASGQVCLGKLALDAPSHDA